VTINTNISTTARNETQHTPISLAVLFGFGLIGIASRRRLKNARILTLVWIVTLTVATLGFSSCSSNKFVQQSTAPVTPAGKYAVTITAQQVGSTTVLVNGVPTTLYGSLNQISLPYTLEVTVQ